MARGVRLVGTDGEEAPLLPEGVLHSGRPPAPWWSTPMFLAPPSGDRLKRAFTLWMKSKRDSS